MAKGLDVARLKQDFPILAREVNGHPLAYLDNASTTQKPRQVIEALSDYYSRYNANVHRALYKLAEEATVAYEEARTRVARFIGAPSEASIVFVRNTTEGINLVAYSYLRKRIRPGRYILLTAMEHHSNLVPWHFVTRETGAKLRFIPMHEDGTLDLSNLEQLLEDVDFVAVTQLSNVLGVVNPVETIIRAAHVHGAKVLIDGAQSVPHLPVDVTALDPDFLVFSGHKMLGPMGIGVLYGRKALLDEMDPFLGGGEMIHTVKLEESTYNEVPWKFEAGTPNVEGAIGLRAAIDYLEAVGVEAIAQHEQALAQYALERLREIRGLTIYGPTKRTGLVSFNLEGIHPHDVSQVLDQDGIAIRAGHHCCQPLMRRLQTPATVRASFYLYNTQEDVDRLAAALRRAKEFFGDGA